MKYETLHFETAGHLSTITLNRPEKRNAISIQMIAELQAALDEIEKTHSRVVIVTGAGKSILRRYRPRLSASHRPTVRSRESGRLQTYREDVSQNLELFPAHDRGGQWTCVGGRVRDRDAV